MLIKKLNPENEILKDGEQIVSVYAATSNNRNLLWVVVRDSRGKLREECIQQEEQSRDMKVLFNVAESINASLVHAVESWRYVYGPVTGRDN